MIAEQRKLFFSFLFLKHDAQSVYRLTIKAEADNEAYIWTTGPTHLPHMFKLLSHSDWLDVSTGCRHQNLKAVSL